VTLSPAADDLPPASPLLADIAPITGVEPGSFANRVLLERHPAIIKQVLEDRPCNGFQTEQLTALLDETTRGLAAPLPDRAWDSSYWRASGAAFFGRPWTQAVFLWAESFFYRRLLQALEFFEPGPWRCIDPFQSMKGAELETNAVGAYVEEIRQLSELTDREAFNALIRAALLGNRADLGFRMGSPQLANSGEEFDLIQDDTEMIWQCIAAARHPRIVILADNAGLEILADLLLADLLIHRCRCSTVTLHLKSLPYYVSDATLVDVLDALRRLGQGGIEAQEVCGRIRSHARTGRLTFRTHEFYCRPECYWMVPSDLRTEFAQADLVIAKGDLNYRRLVGDVECDPTIPFKDACGYFPSSVAALRTLKSEVVLGIPAEVVSRLDATWEKWRTNGKAGVIQFYSGPSQPSGERSL
jgi:hypothetical protein